MIYAIQQGEDGPIKIGKASDVKQRRSELQTGNPEQLNIIACCDWPDDFELRLHSMLSPYRLIGEWFSPSARVLEIVDVISRGDVNELSSVEFPGEHFPWLSLTDEKAEEYVFDVASSAVDLWRDMKKANSRIRAIDDFVIKHNPHGSHTQCAMDDYLNLLGRMGVIEMHEYESAYKRRGWQSVDAVYRKRQKAAK